MLSKTKAEIFLAYPSDKKTTVSNLNADLLIATMS